MSDRWLYRISGKEFGPVSLDLVKTLVAAGTIAPDDEVRDSARSNWILACSATELSGSIRKPVADLVAERREVRDEWYCRGATGEVGPLTLSDLIQLAAEGELRPDEEVKAWADDYWRQIGSISRLVELLPFPNENFGPVLHVLHSDSPSRDEVTRIQQDSKSVDCGDDDRAVIIPFPSPNATQVIIEISDTSSGPMDVMTTASCIGAAKFPEEIDSVGAGKRQLSTGVTTDPSTSEWTGWKAGEEFGPVDFTQLLMWAVTGQLSPSDFVRRRDDHQYVTAVNIPCLFTMRDAASSISRRQVANSHSVPAIAIDELTTVECTRS